MSRAVLFSPHRRCRKHLWWHWASALPRSLLVWRLLVWRLLGLPLVPSVAAFRYASLCSALLALAFHAAVARAVAAICIFASFHVGHSVGAMGSEGSLAAERPRHERLAVDFEGFHRPERGDEGHGVVAALRRWL